MVLHYWYILNKRRGTVLLFLGVFLVTVVIATLNATPYYSSTAVIEISPKEPVVFDVEEVSEMVTGASYVEKRIYYATQYKIIESRAVLEESIRRLREQNGVTDFDDKTNPYAYLKDLLKVVPEIDTHLVNLSVEHPDPATAALFANTIASVYMDVNLDRAMEASKQALTYLRKQQTEFREKALESDTKVHDYKFEYDLVGMNQEQNTALKHLEDLRNDFNNNHTELVKAQAEYGQLQRLFASEDWFGLANHLATSNLVLRDMIGRYQQLRQSRAEAIAQWKAKHPNVIRIDTELAGLEDQIRSQVKDILTASKANIALLEQRERVLEEELDRVRILVRDLDEKLIELKSLEAEADRNETFFKNLDTRMEEVDLSQVIRANNVRFVDVAIPGARPVRPKVLTNLVMALVVGVLGGCSLAFFAEYLDATVKSREDVEAIIGVPFLGIVPSMDPEHLKTLEQKRDRNIVVYSRPRSTLAECLRTIRTNILFRLGNKPVRRLLLTSAAPREGKSFLSANLAAIMAMAGGRTLIIDADLRRSTVHKLFDLPNDFGLADALSGRLRPDQVIQATHVPGLYAMPSGHLPPNPAELLENGRMLQMLEELSKTYDTIIVDSPPVNAVADPLVMASMVDGVVFVVETNQTNRSLVRNARMRLTEVEAPILGAVVNKLDVRRSGYGYYYYYYEKYPYYYSEKEADAEAGSDRA